MGNHMKSNHSDYPYEEEDDTMRQAWLNFKLKKQLPSDPGAWMK